MLVILKCVRRCGSVVGTSDPESAEPGFDSYAAMLIVEPWACLFTLHCSSFSSV